jgi:6-pyruvoyltetrahydropterin/6-carboxytetrahydropterin synthase
MLDKTEIEAGVSVDSAANRVASTVPIDPIIHVSTKTYTHSVGLSACFRQWRAESHCRFLHGYSLSVKVEFAAGNLDIRNWVVDFGSLKSFKRWLEDTFDHKTLVAEDDPEIETFRELDRKGLIQLRIVPGTGCEKFAELIFRYLETWLYENGYSYDGRVRVLSVEVREHESNSAVVVNSELAALNPGRSRLS